MKFDMMEFIAEQTGDVFVRAGVDGITRYVSGSARQYGYEPSDLVGKSGIELVHPDDRERFIANSRSALLGEPAPPFAREHRFRTGDGRWIWMEGNPRPIHDDDGQIVEIVNVFRDINERREAEAALRESEARYRLLAENSTDILASFDTEGRFTYLSAAVQAVFGYLPDELIGQPTHRIMHPEDYAASIRTFGEHLIGPNRDQPFHFAYRGIHKDGRIVWIQSHPRAVFDDAGLVAGFQDVIRDVTARRDAEVALAESEARYRLLAENSTDVLASFSPDARFTYLSPAIERVLGYRPDELIGRRTATIMHPDDYEASLRTYQDHLASPARAEPFHFEYRGIHKDGRTVWLEAHPCAVFDAAGELVGFQDVVRDITARKALEEGLSEALVAAENAAQVKADFMANMSHEIRTPLTAILGFTSLLGARAELPDDVRHKVGRISTAGQTLLAIVNDVLDFSKLEAGQMPLKRRPVSIGETLSECMTLFEPQAEAKAIGLKLQGAEGLPIAEIDPDRIRQVLLNLVGNAVKFTEAGSVTLKASYDRAAERLRIEVVDTGRGMDAEARAHLFQRFSQIDASSTRRHGGTGLGLAICRGLVDAMDGDIGVESAPGKGSTFWFEIAAPLAEVAAMAAPEVSILPGLRVLVADDNPTNLEIVRGLLAPYEAEVRTAVDGIEAVEFAMSEPFDIILMDIRMPRLDGADATLQIRERPGPNQRVPILAFTANFDLERYGEQASRGFNGVARKPVDGPAMLAEIARHTEIDLSAWTAPAEEDQAAT